MIVRSISGPSYHGPRREALAGRGWDHKGLAHAHQKGKRDFQQYLIDAFAGDLVQEGESMQARLSPLTKSKLLRLR